MILPWPQLALIHCRPRTAPATAAPIASTGPAGDSAISTPLTAVPMIVSCRLNGASSVVSQVQALSSLPSAHCSKPFCPSAPSPMPSLFFSQVHAWSIRSRAQAV